MTGRRRNSAPFSQVFAVRLAAVDAMGRGDSLDASGDCLDPISMDLSRRLREHDLQGAIGTDGGVPGFNYGAGLRVRCRKCANCYRDRAWHWRNRMSLECALAPRTWFFTGTFAHPRWTTEKVASKTLTDFLKRLRYYASDKIRYIAIFERHKSGVPHVHALLHETLRGSMTERSIRKAWSAGYDSASLVDGPQAIGYVSKYLFKGATAVCRVRASVRYGMEHDRVSISDPNERSEV